MFLRIDKLQIALETPSKADPTAAAVVQELMGGRFGEMSTLMNYMHQSVPHHHGRHELGEDELRAGNDQDQRQRVAQGRNRQVPRAELGTQERAYGRSDEPE